MAEGKTLTGERRVVTAMFCDLVGSTAMAEEMDPEDWSEIVAAAVATMSETVAQYGGTVTQFAGDGVLAIFGAPVAHEDDPYRAVRSALDILTRAKAQDVELRIGINTGLMVISDMDAGAFSGYAALGDAVNAAARIEGLAPPGSVLIGGPTAKLVGADFELRDMGETEVKGKTRPVHLFEVVGASGTPTRGRGLTGLRSALVGREDELQTLTSLVDAARAGRGRFAAVVGEPGIGKSRLLRELASAVQADEGTSWVVGRCLSYGATLPYHLVASMLRSLARVPEGESAAEAGSRVADLAARVFGAGSDQMEEAGPLLQQLVGARAGARDTEAQYRHIQYVNVLADLLAGLCAEQTMVLVCEDVHWADASSVELLDAVFARCHDLPLATVLVTRPDREHAGWKLVTTLRSRLGEAFTEIRLRPLPEHETRQLVANLLDVESLPEELRIRLLNKTDGNPFFVEEVVRMLIDRGMIENHDGRWVATEAVNELEVPGTVRGLLTARIDLLPPDVRRAGMMAAVIGREFSADLFARLHPSPREGSSVHPDLGQLEAQGFIVVSSVRPRLEFAFRHALVHDVMYETLLKRERKQLHQRVGETIEAQHGDDTLEISPVLAEHFERAGDAERARKYLMQAGQHAMARHAAREAHAFFERAHRRMQSGGPDLARDRIEAVLGMGEAGYSFVPGNQQLATYRAARADLDTLDDPDLRARVYMLQLRIMHDVAATPGDAEYMALTHETFELVDRVRDPVTLALLKGNIGQTMRFSNDPEAAMPLLEEAFDALEAAGMYGHACFNACAAVDCTATMGRFAEADAWMERANRVADLSGDPNARLDVNLLRGRLAGERGELDLAARHLSQSIAAADQYGNTFCELVGNFFAADQRLRVGQPREAVSFLSRANELATYCNAGPLELLSRAWLAAARSALGEDANADFQELLAAARDTGSLMAEGHVLAHKATAAAGSDDPDWDTVSADFERAVECYEAVHARPAMARTLHTFGSALEVAGMTDRGAEVLRRAASIFAELGIEPVA